MVLGLCKKTCLGCVLCPPPRLYISFLRGRITSYWLTHALYIWLLANGVRFKREDLYKRPGHIAFAISHCSRIAPIHFNRGDHINANARDHGPF